MSIHSTAIIDPSAKIAASVHIGPYAIIGPGVVLGENCRIHPHAVLEYAELEAGCEVYSFASIGLPPQHLAYKGEATKVIVGEKTIFRENVTVHRGTIQDKGLTRIGKNCFFMALSHVAHDCQIGDNVIVANGSLLAGHVSIGDRVFISGLVAFHQHVRIGKGAMISGGSMVSLDVPPFGLVQGDRAKLYGMNVVGMRRSGLPKESVRLLKDAYQTVFYSGKSLETALTDPIFNSNDGALQDLKEFLSTPKRGFVRPVSQTDSADAEEAVL